MSTTSFEVKLENVKLSTDQVAQIQKEINAVVARHMVQISPNKDHPIGVYGKLHPEWFGIWLRQFQSIADLQKHTDFKQFDATHM